MADSRRGGSDDDDGAPDAEEIVGADWLLEQLSGGGPAHAGTPGARTPDAGGARAGEGTDAGGASAGEGTDAGGASAGEGTDAGGARADEDMDAGVPAAGTPDAEGADAAGSDGAVLERAGLGGFGSGGDSSDGPRGDAGGSVASAGITAAADAASDGTGAAPTAAEPTRPTPKARWSWQSGTVEPLPDEDAGSPVDAARTEAASPFAHPTESAAAADAVGAGPSDGTGTGPSATRGPGEPPLDSPLGTPARPSRMVPPVLGDASTPVSAEQPASTGSTDPAAPWNPVVSADTASPSGRAAPDDQPITPAATAGFFWGLTPTDDPDPLVHGAADRAAGHEAAAEPAPPEPPLLAESPLRAEPPLFTAPSPPVPTGDEGATETAASTDEQPLTRRAARAAAAATNQAEPAAAETAAAEATAVEAVSAGSPLVEPSVADAKPDGTTTGAEHADPTRVEPASSDPTDPTSSARPAAPTEPIGRSADPWGAPFSPSADAVWSEEAPTERLPAAGAAGAAADGTAGDGTAGDGTAGDGTAGDETAGIGTAGRAAAADRGAASVRRSVRRSVGRGSVGRADAPTATGESGGPRRMDRGIRVLLLVVGSLLVVLLLILFFVLGTRLTAGSSQPVTTPTPTATRTPTPTPTPTPTVPPTPKGPAAAGVHPWDALGGGECLQPYSSPWAQSFTVVSCTAPHTAQLVRRGTFSTEPGMAYPGAQALAGQIDLLCQKPGVIDLSAAGAYSDIQVQGTYPATAAQWASGQRSYFCFVSRSSGKSITGSLAG